MKTASAPRAVGWASPAATINALAVKTARAKFFSRNQRKAAIPAMPRAAHIISIRPTAALHVKVKSTARRPIVSKATRRSSESFHITTNHDASATKPQKTEYIREENRLNGSTRNHRVSEKG